MASVRICVEGGGKKRRGRQLVRQGFSRFLREFEGAMPAVIPCGGRDETYEFFRNEVQKHPDAFVILLVDSERAVVAPPSQHLTNADGWDLSEIDDQQAHLMVQAVEAWLIADRNTLRDYYGSRLNENALPDRRNLESVPQSTLKSALNQATKKTPKGGYHEIEHCSEILARLDPAVVRGACPHCRRLFAVLSRETGVALPNLQ